ncbi:hypothetical protein CA51_28220 [Rosistilla oblonga]|uniref:Uncharacterized protein n=1 Tax=Rosistilla oblonga TaxID=2527990 RepID=A0A518J0N8_9BACT|nr:hypothetical protein [Rosistilla oblonga]QDV12936.1 hypothetical protein CA51_28220 [Rosistilla oblonga]QDV58899.1 hypothetical protein Mal33_49240 [Rosistilla oblonga]
MKRIQSMWRATRILWAILLVIGIALPWIDPIMFTIWLINIPICIGVFFYFAYVRYDEDGNDLER